MDDAQQRAKLRLASMLASIPASLRAKLGEPQRIPVRQPAPVAPHEVPSVVDRVMTTIAPNNESSKGATRIQQAVAENRNSERMAIDAEQVASDNAYVEDVQAQTLGNTPRSARKYLATISSEDGATGAAAIAQREAREDIADEKDARSVAYLLAAGVPVAVVSRLYDDEQDALINTIQGSSSPESKQSLMQAVQKASEIFKRSTQ